MFLPFQYTYWKCNFPMTPHVFLLVSLLVRYNFLEPEMTKLHFHPSIGAFFLLINMFRYFKYEYISPSVTTTRSLTAADENHASGVTGSSGTDRMLSVIRCFILKLILFSSHIATCNDDVR